MLQLLEDYYLDVRSTRMCTRRYTYIYTSSRTIAKNIEKFFENFNDINCYIPLYRGLYMLDCRYYQLCYNSQAKIAKNNFYQEQVTIFTKTCGLIRKVFSSYNFLSPQLEFLKNIQKKYTRTMLLAL